MLGHKNDNNYPRIISKLKFFYSLHWNFYIFQLTTKIKPLQNCQNSTLENANKMSNFDSQ